MKFAFRLIFSLFAVFLTQAYSQTIKNGDFAKGKSSWLGDGKLVYLSADGKIADTETPGAEKVLQIELKKTKWSTINQSLFPLAKDDALSVSIMVKAQSDFAPLDESHEYSKVDFQEGGSYVWSAEVAPKCDFLVRVHDSTWYYRPVTLKPVDTWKTLNLNFKNLKARNRSLTIALPPGSGTVLIKYVK